MSKREWLRSQGFHVGERGRLNPAMLRALEDYPGDQEILQAEIVTNNPQYVAEKLAVRDLEVFSGLARDGKKITFVTCYDCKEHVTYCTCEKGVQAPPDVIKLLDGKEHVRI